MTEKDEAPPLIAQMMERIGVDPAGGVLPQYSLRYAAARRNCAACKSKPACLKWLDTHAVAYLAPMFCPNADVFFELQYDQHRVT